LLQDLTEKDIQILIVLVGLESSDGHVPLDISLAKAWALLNMISFRSDDINHKRGAFKDGPSVAMQSAEGKLLADQGFSGTYAEIRAQLLDKYRKGTDLPSEYFKELDPLVRQAVKDWTAYGPGSSKDPTNGAMSGFRDMAGLYDKPVKDGGVQLKDRSDWEDIYSSEAEANFWRDTAVSWNVFPYVTRVYETHPGEWTFTFFKP
jgi:hypothetical protein